jgi:hypothetical protein
MATEALTPAFERPPESFVGAIALGIEVAPVAP